jgi:hypothetical protein
MIGSEALCASFRKQHCAPTTSVGGLPRYLLATIRVEEKPMSTIKPTNTVLSLRSVALAVLSLGFAAIARFPAAARVAAHDPRSTRHQQENFYFNYSAPQPGSTYDPSARAYSARGIFTITHWPHHYALA